MIDDLLESDKPAFIDCDYPYLCTNLLNYFDYDSLKSKDFEFPILSFMDDFEMDVRERLGDYNHSYSSYLCKVEYSLHYFLKYLEQLDWLPHAADLEIFDGSFSSVLRLRVTSRTKRWLRIS